MITGGCLCGAVRYEITGTIGPVIYCHCSQCRRASGSAFAANASVRSEYLTFISGRDAIREFESSPGKFRGFCSECGSPLYSRREAVPDAFRIRLGTLDGDPERRSVAHIWVGSKAPWFEITDDIARFEAEDIPPDYLWPSRSEGDA